MWPSLTCSAQRMLKKGMERGAFFSVSRKRMLHAPTWRVHSAYCEEEIYRNRMRSWRVDWLRL